MSPELWRHTQSHCHLNSSLVPHICLWLVPNIHSTHFVQQTIFYFNPMPIITVHDPQSPCLPNPPQIQLSSSLLGIIIPGMLSSPICFAKKAIGASSKVYHPAGEQSLGGSNSEGKGIWYYHEEHGTHFMHLCGWFGWSKGCSGQTENTLWYSQCRNLL